MPTQPLPSSPPLYQPYQKGSYWAFDCITEICGRKMRATSDGFLCEEDAARAAKSHESQEQAKDASCSAPCSDLRPPTSDLAIVRIGNALTSQHPDCTLLGIKPIGHGRYLSLLHRTDDTFPQNILLTCDADAGSPHHQLYVVDAAIAHTAWDTATIPDPQLPGATIPCLQLDEEMGIVITSEYPPLTSLPPADPTDLAPASRTHYETMGHDMGHCIRTLLIHAYACAPSEQAIQRAWWKRGFLRAFPEAAPLLSTQTDPNHAA